MFTNRDGHKRLWNRLKDVTDFYPLWPLAGYESFETRVWLKNAMNMAFREPGPLIEAWGLALAVSERMPDAFPCDKTLLLVSDGLQDKSGLYHFGFRFAEDTNTLSRNSQRDLIVGKVSEKNQLHMITVGAMCRVTYDWATSRGYDVIWLSDWESLRAVAAGIWYDPGGQCYAPVNTSMPTYWVAHAC